jgi:hypothetical protein
MRGEDPDDIGAPARAEAEDLHRPVGGRGVQRVAEQVLDDGEP